MEKNRQLLQLRKYIRLPNREMFCNRMKLLYQFLIVVVSQKHVFKCGGTRSSRITRIDCVAQEFRVRSTRPPGGAVEVVQTIAKRAVRESSFSLPSVSYFRAPLRI